MSNNLIKFRQQLGFTQVEFAEILNVDRQYQQNVEKGRRKGSADYWLRIMEKFKLTCENINKLREVSSNETT